MDLEARALQPNVKAMLLTKLREYKNDLNNLKSEIKRLSSTDSQAARDALLESGMADALMVRIVILRISFLLARHMYTTLVSYSRKN